MIAQGRIVYSECVIESGGLNGCLKAWAHKQIADTFAVRAFPIAVVSGSFAVGTFVPVKLFGRKCVNAVAALLVAGFATTTVRDPDVVASAATLCTARDR